MAKNHIVPYVANGRCCVDYPLGGAEHYAQRRGFDVDAVDDAGGSLLSAGR